MEESPVGASPESTPKGDAPAGSKPFSVRGAAHYTRTSTSNTRTGHEGRVWAEGATEKSPTQKVGDGSPACTPSPRRGGVTRRGFVSGKRPSRNPLLTGRRRPHGPTTPVPVLPHVSGHPSRPESHPPTIETGVETVHRDPTGYP